MHLPSIATIIRDEGEIVKNQLIPPLTHFLQRNLSKVMSKIFSCVFVK